MTQQRLGSVAFQDEAAGPAVEVCRQQEASHRRLEVLLFILVCVERVLQVCWDAVCVIEGQKCDVVKFSGCINIAVMFSVYIS